MHIHQGDSCRKQASEQQWVCGGRPCNDTRLLYLAPSGEDGGWNPVESNGGVIN